MSSLLPNCVFCERILRRRSDVVCDQALAENDEYIVVPTKGSLVPGWLLVVAKVHVLCTGAARSFSPVGLQEMMRVTKHLIEPRFGPVTLFEHGPVTDGTALGCGVDHLHVHVAPLQFSLRMEFQRLFPASKWRGIADWQSLREVHREGVPYVAVQEPGGPLEWCEAPPNARQPLRRAIASAIGDDERFDYNLYPYDENIARTIEALSAA